MYSMETDKKHDELIGLLEEFLGESRKHYESKGQITFDCPNCSSEKGVDFDGKGNLEINYELGVYNCWACAETDGTKGKLYYLFKDYAEKDILKRFIKAKFVFDNDFYSDDFELIERPKLYLPDDYIGLAGRQNSTLFNSAFAYLYGRGITDEIIAKYKIGYALNGIYQNRVIIPSYSADGLLNYFIARAISKQNTKYKYLNPDVEKTEIIFNELLIDWEKPIFLVEGAFDHICIPNSIPLLGKKMYDKLFNEIYFKAKSAIIIVLDNDAYNDAVKVYNMMDAGKLRNRIFINKMPPDEDVSSFNEKYGQDNLFQWLKKNNFKLTD